MSAKAGISVWKRVVGLTPSTLFAAFELPLDRRARRGDRDDVAGGDLLQEEGAVRDAAVPDSGPMVRVATNTLTASSTRKKTIQRGETPNLGRWGGVGDDLPGAGGAGSGARPSACWAMALGYSAPVSVAGGSGH